LKRLTILALAVGLLLAVATPATAGNYWNHEQYDGYPKQVPVIDYRHQTELGGYFICQSTERVKLNFRWRHTDGNTHKVNEFRIDARKPNGTEKYKDRAYYDFEYGYNWQPVGSLIFGEGKIASYAYMHEWTDAGGPKALPYDYDPEYEIRFLCV